MDLNSPSHPWLSRTPYSPASRSNSRGGTRASESNSPTGKEGSASSWGYRQPSPGVSASVSNKLFDEPLASSTSIARAVDDDNDGGVGMEQPSEPEGDDVSVETEQPESEPEYEEGDIDSEDAYEDPVGPAANLSKL